MGLDSRAGPAVSGRIKLRGAAVHSLAAAFAPATGPSLQLKSRCECLDRRTQSSADDAGGQKHSDVAALRLGARGLICSSRGEDQENGAAFCSASLRARPRLHVGLRRPASLLQASNVAMSSCRHPNPQVWGPLRRPATGQKYSLMLLPQRQAALATAQLTPAGGRAKLRASAQLPLGDKGPPRKLLLDLLWDV